MRNLKNLEPKSIMVREIEGVTIFTQKLESECDPNFIAEVAGRCIKLFGNSFCVKREIIDFLKEQNF